MSALLTVVALCSPAALLARGGLLLALASELWRSTGRRTRMSMRLVSMGRGTCCQPALEAPSFMGDGAPGLGGMAVTGDPSGRPVEQ